jgi:hypothetical protein
MDIQRFRENFFFFFLNNAQVWSTGNCVEMWLDRIRLGETQKGLFASESSWPVCGIPSWSVVVHTEQDLSRNEGSLTYYQER